MILLFLGNIGINNVIYSPAQMTWTAKMATQMAKLKFGSEHLISYLPLSHVAAQMIDIYVPILCASTVWFAQPDAMKVSCQCLNETLVPRECRSFKFVSLVFAVKHTHVLLCVD